MARRDALTDEGRAVGQRQRRLGDVAFRLGDQQLAELLDLLLGRRRPDQHAVAAGTVHFLDHQFGQVVEHEFQVLGLAAHIGRHVVQLRFLVEIEADHVWHVGVDRLVVGNAGADGIGQRDVACLVGAQEAWYAESRIGAESQWIEKIVVDAAVDDIDALRPLRRAHVCNLVFDEEIAPFDQFDAHLLSKEGVLEIGAVIGAGRQHDDGRIADALGRHGAQLFQQQVGIMLDRRHLVPGEQFGEQAHHHLAVFQHV